MKVVILAGGLGTRLAEETEVRPKPMVEIGGRPILWHIMRHYAHYGFKEFVVALGYRGEFVKRWFLDYHHLSGSITIGLADGQTRWHQRGCEDWTVHLMDTGTATNTGGRVKRLEPLLQEETFLLTYGDGVANVDLKRLIAQHRSAGRTATITAVRPPARFGGLELDGEMVAQFTEKPQIGEGWINGGYMVLEPAVFRRLADDHTSLESDALESLAGEKQLAAYRHSGFWQCMDTLRDKRQLDGMWERGDAPWKVWA